MGVREIIYVGTKLVMGDQWVDGQMVGILRFNYSDGVWVCAWRVEEEW